MATLGFDGFVSSIANVIAHHVSDAAEDVTPSGPEDEDLRRQAVARDFLDPEKVVWHFPDSGSRLIEAVP